MRARGTMRWWDGCSTQGVANIEALNGVLARGAKPWWSAYGGRDRIEVVEQVVS